LSRAGSEDQRQDSDHDREADEKDNPNGTTDELEHGVRSLLLADCT
jgi:hypothetical protein